MTIEYKDSKRIITYPTEYKVHTFTSSGTFAVTGSGNIEYLVVAGGGGGAGCDATPGGSGGGAGGLRTNVSGATSGGNSNAEATYGVTAQNYTITIGSGGSGGGTAGDGESGTDGNDSSIAPASGTTITSIGGGGGGAYYRSPGGKSGGSGGGTAWATWSGTAGGAGTSGQGFAGGNNPDSSSGSLQGGSGGGGAGALGANGGGNGGNGGIGLQSSINGTTTYYAGGGAGALGNSTGSNGTAGSGSIGQGGNGSANSGSGTAGANGIVIVRYDSNSSITATGGTITTVTGGEQSKPTDVQDNSILVEKDTARRYWFDTEDSGGTDIEDKTLVQNGADITYTSGYINVNIGNTPSSEGDYLLHTLDVPITTTDFVLDFDYYRVSGGTNCFAGLVFRSNQSGESIENSNTGDYIRTSPNAAGSSMNMYWHNDGDSTETELGYLTGLNAAGNWNYLRLTRTNGTTIKLERFSSAARSGSADATVTATNLSATWGLSLKYIGGYCAHVGSSAGNGLHERFQNIDLSSTTKSATWTMQPTFRDDFSSDAWVDQDTEQQVTGGSLAYDPKRDNTNDASSYDLQIALGSGVNADNEKWVLQYVQNHTSVYTSGNGNRLWFGISDSPSSTAQNGTHQFIGLYQNFDYTSKYGAIGVDGGALPQSNTATVVPATGTDYYTRITRVSSTSMRVQIWTGGYDQTVFYDETLTIASTLVDLRYIWIGNFMSSAGGNSITGTIDNLEFYNGVSSIT